MRYEVEVTVASAKNLKNVNWKNGSLHPYAVLWVDPSAKASTKVDIDNDDDPVWDEKLTIPLPHHISVEEAVLSIDVVHANAQEDVKPLVGSARLPLHEVVEETGIGSRLSRTLKVKRPSGRPHGKLEIKVCIKEPTRHYDAPPPYGVPYGSSRDYSPYGAPPPPHSGGGYGYGGPPQPHGYPYGAAPPHPGDHYGYGAPPAHPGDHYGYGAPPPPSGYGAPPPPSGYPQQYGDHHQEAPKEKKGMGMGAGLAIGAAAGVVGGIALAEGYEALKEDIVEEAVEEAEEAAEEAEEDE